MNNGDIVMVLAVLESRWRRMQRC